MPLSIAQLRNATRPITLKVGGDTLTAIVRFGKYTPEYHSTLKDLTGPQFIADMVESWDLMDEDGETPYPLTADMLERLPAEFLTPLVEAIHEDSVPNSPTPARSGSFS